MRGVKYSLQEKNNTMKKELYEKGCLDLGLNQGPPVYKTGALPLSYRGERYW
jgi:hypothetical protein